ncbi:hypothetical protein [Leifsonia sp. NPDC080035]|uniref:Uncharacterized protein n=1 Tax=Leifsonia sp. NPDC080035 TaxID=3143936 RepID=A0AAU7GI73_9MICO
MAELFSHQACGHCGQRHPVLADGRISLHFTDGGDRCAGSERRGDEGGVSVEQARRIEAELRRVLRQVMVRRA